MSVSIELRRCHGIEEFRACVALQKEVWNFTDAELVPLRMFVVADKVGGQVMGAFDGDPGVRPSYRQFVAYAAPWDELPDDGLERYPEGKPR